ncbi:MAG: DUF4381 domain-containing protein [Tatlockia sp.]|nr:DUF4381 domain-containing protein [Tatlockia sp.]
MSEPPELAKLHDIHLPEAIGWWPLAEGWYLLFLLVLIIICLASYYANRFHKNGKAKREALRLLKIYEQEYHSGADSQTISMKISELLRRVALVYFPRKEVAGLQGQAWLNFLSQTSKKIDFNSIEEYLLALPYQPSKNIDLKPLFCRARGWIKQRGKPCLN